MTSCKNILERLSDNIIIGDGGFCYGLEKRGYVKGGQWTPECVVKHPDAVKQLHREFLRAGSDVMQAFTFFASDDKYTDVSKRTSEKFNLDCNHINKKACELARQVANEGDALVSGSLTKLRCYVEGKGKKVVQDVFRKQILCFIEQEVDFVICEFFFHIEELEWAIEVAREANKPVAVSMCIGPLGDSNGISTGECAVRMAKAGADIIGVNCGYEPDTGLNTVKMMKESLDKADLHPYLMLQPLGYKTSDLSQKEYYGRLPETPFELHYNEPVLCILQALETRSINRFEAAKWARECYEVGIRYIGGCCGFEPHHIRAISEELWKERGKQCIVTEENGFLLDGLTASTLSYYEPRKNLEYWKNLKPTSGRPYSSAYAYY